MKFLVPFFALLLTVFIPQGHAAPSPGGKMVETPVVISPAKGLVFTEGRMQITGFRTSTDTAGVEHLLADGIITGHAKNKITGQESDIVTAATAEVTDINGHNLSGFSKVALLAQAAQCTILNLTLGPINLDLLGLIVQTNQIHVLITAQQGGGLLGDLLCAIDNLLNGGTGGILQQIADLLNQILQAL